MTKRRLLWIGDAGVSSGFARATHYTLDVLRRTFDVSVLGLNYKGDPHPYPYPIYPCYPGGDLFGLGRLEELLPKLQPSIVVVQNDPWNFQGYIQRCGNVPVVGAVAVDGKNCRGEQLNGLASAIFWTKFGEQQARLGGYAGSSTVIPLGVDLSIYYPMDQEVARAELRMPEIFAKRGLPEDTFLIGVVGRNQPRKRLDLTLEYFAEWVKYHSIDNAAIWMHVAPTGERAFDLMQLAKYYGIEKRIIIPQIEPMHGVPEDVMRRIYSAMDMLMTTTQGEGFGLPIFEAMACGVPVVVPDWSALGELVGNAGIKVPCTSTAATLNGINVIGGIADKQKTIDALTMLYASAELREKYSKRGLEAVEQDCYRWENIGEAFSEVVESSLYPEDIAFAPLVTLKQHEMASV